MEQQRFRYWAFVWRQLVGYALALILIFLIYQAQIHHLLTAGFIALSGGMLALSLLRQSSSQIGRTWLFSLTIALAVGQIAWTLTIWQSSVLPTTLSLFLAFYIFIGLAQQHLADKLSPRV